MARTTGDGERWFHLAVAAGMVPVISLPWVAWAARRAGIEGGPGDPWGRRTRLVLALDLAVAAALLGALLLFGPGALRSDRAEQQLRIGVIPDPAARGDGLRVGAPAPGSPAERAGVLPGDLVTALDGQPVRTAADLSAALGRGPARARTLTLLRAGAAVTLVVTPEATDLASRRLGLFQSYPASPPLEWRPGEALLLQLPMLVVGAALLALALKRRQSPRALLWVVGGQLCATAAGGAVGWALLRLLGGATWGGALLAQLAFSAGLAPPALLAGARVLREDGGPAATAPAAARNRALLYAAAFSVRANLLGALVAGGSFGSGTPLDRLAGLPRAGLPLLALAMVIVAPPAEELLFRGVLHPWLRRFLPASEAIGLGSLLFAAAHASYGAAALGVFARGCALAWAREEGGDLRAPIAVHMMLNGASLLLSLPFAR